MSCLTCLLNALGVCFGGHAGVRETGAECENASHADRPALLECVLLDHHSQMRRSVSVSSRFLSVFPLETYLPGFKAQHVACTVRQNQNPLSN